MKKYHSFIGTIPDLESIIVDMEEDVLKNGAKNIVLNSNKDIVPIDSSDLRKSAVNGKNKALWTKGRGRWETPYARRRYFNNRTGKPLWILVELKRNKKIYQNMMVDVFFKSKKDKLK